jgi:hypothetical protein
MKLSLNSLVKISALSVLAIAPVFLSSSRVFAQTTEGNQPTGMTSTYVGAGVATGVTSGGQGGDAATFGGNIQGRAAIPNSPVSVRGAVLFTDKTSAVMPILSYDVPIANNTNVYVGAGYSFVQQSPGASTPLGNQNAVVLTTGVETQVGDGIILYSDAKLGINAYQNSPAQAVSIQAGAGYRF